MQKDFINIPTSSANVSVVIQINPRARKLGLRLDPMDDIAYLTSPAGVPRHKIHSFLTSHLPWLEKKLSQRPIKTSFEENNTIPILGFHYRISYEYADKPFVQLTKETLEIKGFDPIIIPGLTLDWLKQHIYRYVADCSKKHSNIIGKDIKDITVKDLKSRWGSCSSDGSLVYSWRLVFASHNIIDYVCAHEVAHLLEMNHSERFWQVVEQLCPDYINHRLWLKKQGQSLFRYG